MSSYKDISTRIMYITIDILCILFAGFTSVWLRFFSGFFDSIEGIENLLIYYQAFLIVIPVFIIINISLKLYKESINVDFYKEVSKILMSNIISVSILMSISFIVKSAEIYSRLVLGFFIGFNLIYVLLARSVYRFILIQAFKRGSKFKILILGTGKLAQMFSKSIERYKKWGYEICGFLIPDDGINRNIDFNDKILGTFSEFRELQQKYNFDEVVVALHIDEATYIDLILRICDMEGVRIKIIPGYYEHLKYSTYIEDFNGIPLLTVRNVPLDSAFNRFLKRSFDIVFSLIAIIITSPIMLTVAVINKVSSPHEPILFKQERISLNNNTFVMLKFRSMKTIPEEEEKMQWSKKGDPRITKFGAFIRKTSIDELPQFFNVFKGEMSVVGPRPERPFWVERFKDDIPQYMLRHYVKSGITGWAQVNGLRGDTSIEERIKYDNYYIQNWSIMLDLRIIFRTVFGDETNKNAY